MEAQLKTFCGSSISHEEKVAGISTLIKIVQNILENPDVEKYRQLKITNPSFNQCVWRHTAAQEFLALAGWVLQDDKIVINEDEKLKEAHAVLAKAEKWLERLEQKVNVDYITNEEIGLKFGFSEHEVEVLRRYRSLLPKELEDFNVRFHFWDIMCSSGGSLDEAMAVALLVKQTIAMKYRTALRICEQRDFLHDRQKQAGDNDNERQRIEKKLAELEVEEHKLIWACEDECITLAETAIQLCDIAPEYFEVCRESSEAELEKRRKKKKNRPTLSELEEKLAKKFPLTSTSLDFSDYVSSLPATAQSYLEKAIDCDHEGVDIHLNTIAFHMIDWEEKLSALLGLTDIEIKDLKSTHSTFELLRRGVLKKWKEKEGFRATYEKLLKLCCNAGDARTANSICQVLKEKAEEIDGKEEECAYVQEDVPISTKPHLEETVSVQEKAMPADPLSKKPRPLPLCKEMAVLSEQWKDVGLFLDLSQQDLDDIESGHSSASSQCMTAVLKKWLLRDDPPPTWKTVIEVVEFLQHEDVASALKCAAAD